MNRKRPVYIFGHTSPDTDSICSSIAYAELKRETGEQNVEVFRLGEISKETNFVLDYFGVPVPKLLENVKPQLSDLQYYEPVTVARDCSLKEAWDTIKNSSSTRIVAIVDDSGILNGVASVGDLVRVFMGEARNLPAFEISYENILAATEGRLVCGGLPSGLVTGSICLDSEINAPGDIRPDDVVIISDERNLEKYAERCGCIIVSESVSAGEERLKSIRRPAILTPLSPFQIIRGLDKAISIGSVMVSENIERFTLDNYIEDVIDATKHSTHRNFPVLDSNGRLAGIISRRHLINYLRKKVILIDHNESHQSVDGIESADITEIIDHHRVANVQTQTPLFIRSEPVGSTATIIFKMYMEHFLRPKKEIAGIMLSAVLSDTLLFNSPTCTPEDREAAYKLAKIAGVDIDEYGETMFRESASFDEYTEAEILAIDRKEFSFGKYRAFISQVNVIEYDSMAKRRELLLGAMDEFRLKTECDLVVLMVTDIINNGSEIMCTPFQPEVLLSAFDIPPGTNSAYLPKIVSRKKQIVPRLLKAVQM